LRGQRSSPIRESWCGCIVLLWLMMFARSLCAQTTSTPLLPTGVAYDAAGNLYFADTNRHQVFESSLAGKLTVVAGSGVQGYGGDGGAATSALLDSPRAVAVGLDGTLYIADTGNQRIRAVVGGKMATFAGTGIAGYGGDSGAATAALLNEPNSLAIDLSGALLVCDSANQRIRRISGGTITIFAGSGTQGFAGDGGAAIAASLDTPSGIAVAADGRIFIADTHNDRVRVVSATGIIGTFAGTGVRAYSGDGAAATAAELALPQGVVVGSTGAVIFADSNNQRIRMVDASGKISTIAGEGVQGNSVDGSSGVASTLDTPSAVAVSSFGSPVFAEGANQAVRELVSNGNVYLPAGLQPTRTSAVSLNVGSSATYGQAIASVFVSGTAGMPQGIVQLVNGANALAQQSLVSAAASFPLALAPGSYVLSADYEGDGVNPAASSGASSVAIGQAATSTVEQPIAQNSYAGLPLVLSADVTSTSSGVITGTVSFVDGGTVVATATPVGGIATGTYLAPTAGTHSIVANYSGDADDAASSSSPVTTTISTMPDFSLTSVGSATQTVQVGAIAVYVLNVAAQAAAFTGVVSMSVSGLPKGFVATFSPPQTVPGAGSAVVTLSIQTPVMAMVREPGAASGAAIWCAAMLPLCLLCKRRLYRRSLVAMVFVICCAGMMGCGDRTLSSATQASQTYNLTVTGTSTNLTGSILVHSTPISLIVQ
jgi:sugar lactone lactonase YvrE